MSNNELAVIYEVDGNEIKLTPSIVQEYIVGSNAKITLPEFKFFTELCKARGLNPFLKEAYCIKYGNEPAAMVVGKVDNSQESRQKKVKNIQEQTKNSAPSIELPSRLE